MNCRDIERILDDHSATQLSAAQQTEFDAHLTDCSRCRRAAQAQAMLQSERPEGPRPGLFEAVTRRAARADAAPAPRAQARRWQTLAGLGAAAALVLVAVLAFSGLERNVTGTSPGDGPVAASSNGVADRSGFVEGEHYLRLAAQPGTREATSATVSVIEFFMYLCNHCYRFELHLGAWMSEQAPDRVEVTRVPVQWNAAAAMHARAFYAAESLGIADEIHLAFFEQVHDRGNTLASEAGLREFFSRFGIGGDAFDEAFHSAAVDAKLQRANRIAARYGIDATPTVIVGDAYLATPGTAGSQEDLTDLIDWLVDRVAAACSVEATLSSGGQRCPAD
jgi:thiol:disulfide interchange protein DsbA